VIRELLTPLEPEGSRVFAHAFMLCWVSEHDMKRVGGSQRDMTNFVFGQEAVQEGEQGLVVTLACVAQSEHGVWVLV
jgi:hypothetical protein